MTLSITPAPDRLIVTPAMAGIPLGICCLLLVSMLCLGIWSLLVFAIYRWWLHPRYYAHFRELPHFHAERPGEYWKRCVLVHGLSDAFMQDLDTSIATREPIVLSLPKPRSILGHSLRRYIHFNGGTFERVDKGALGVRTLDPRPPVEAMLSQALIPVSSPDFSDTGCTSVQPRKIFLKPAPTADIPTQGSDGNDQ